MSVRVAFQPTDAPNGVDEVRLAPRSERPLPPRSPQTVAHDAAFPRDIPDILLTFLFLRQPASVASPLLRRRFLPLLIIPIGGRLRRPQLLGDDDGDPSFSVGGDLARRAYVAHGIRSCDCTVSPRPRDH